MTGLDSWLDQATRDLSTDSAAQVRAEIREHYESAREAALGGGATAAEGDRIALDELGDARTANCQYRQVLLTSAEAKVLHEGNWEAQAVCSRPWIKTLLLAVPVAVLTAAAAFLATGAVTVARDLLTVGMATGFLFAAPFLPIYTPSRGLVVRCLKWVVLVATFVLILGPAALKWSWLLLSCLWPLAWIEWTRVSIRRKLPAAEWPKQLYL